MIVVHFPDPRDTAEEKATLNSRNGAFLLHPRVFFRAAWGMDGAGTWGFPQGWDRGCPSSGHLTAAPTRAGVILSDRNDGISEETGTGPT